MIGRWTNEPLANIATLQRGFDLPSRLRKRGEVPVVTSSGVGGEGHCEARVNGPGVVTGRYGTIGQVFFVRDDFWPLNTTLYVRDFHGNDPLFVSYLLRTIDYHTHSGKSGVPGVNRNDLHEVMVAFPPTKAEQHAVARALSDVDAHVESLEQILAKKRQLKQGAMQELLIGKKRLPGFEVKTGYRQTAIGMIPEDWEFKRLAEIFTFQNGVNAEKSAYGSGIPFINVLEVITHPVITETMIPGRVSLSSQAIKVFAAKFGDVVFNRTSETQEEVGLAAVYAGSEDVLFGGFVIRARPRHSRLDSVFIAHALRSQPIRLQIVARGQGAVRANIGQQQLSRVQIFLPAAAEQEAIATILSDMDAEITALEAKLAKARQIKQGMMQQLLTGKIRLV